jgi:hypothetical protein
MNLEIRVYFLDKILGLAGKKRIRALSVHLFTARQPGYFLHCYTHFRTPCEINEYSCIRNYTVSGVSCQEVKDFYL